MIFDKAITRCEKVSISSGDPMAGLELGSGDLIQVAGAQLAPIAEVKRTDRTGSGASG